ncbi:hypothetical protein BC833DRAFT_566826 [Globomyces pollinis-pini]|nr:hypothetical protein BC833DRAFT_566826 [Globomyces pollinis-pini]
MSGRKILDIAENLNFRKSELKSVQQHKKHREEKTGIVDDVQKEFEIEILSPLAIISEENPMRVSRNYRQGQVIGFQKLEAHPNKKQYNLTAMKSEKKSALPMIQAMSNQYSYNFEYLEDLKKSFENSKKKKKSIKKISKESIMFDQLRDLLQQDTYECDADMYAETEQIHKLRLQGIMDIVKNKPKPCKLYNGYQADTWYRLSGQASKAKKITPKLPPPESKQGFLRKVASALPADSIARVKFALDQEHPSEAHAVFKKIDKLNRKKRVIIDKQLFIDLLQLPKDLRTKEHRRYIDDFLRSLPAFQTTPEYIFPHLAKELNVVSYPKDHILFYQGDPGDKWYVILEGTISISINKPGWPGPPPIPQIPVAAMREGDKFGDLALLNDLLRSTSVTISSDHCTFITLDKPQFIRLMGPANKHDTSEKMTFLRKVSLFASMDRKSLKQVADKTVVRQAKEDTVLIREGQTLATAFVIRKGTCAVFRNVTFKKGSSEVTKQMLLGHINKYDCFNQESIWGNMGVKTVSPFTVVSIGSIEFATIIIQKEWLDSGLKVNTHPFGTMKNEELVRRYHTTKYVDQFRSYQKTYIDKSVLVLVQFDVIRTCNRQSETSSFEKILTIDRQDS